jgi:hypothetical protein
MQFLEILITTNILIEYHQYNNDFTIGYIFIQNKNILLMNH